MADWERWHLNEAFANPEDYFRQCLAWMAELRESDINAIRANPEHRRLQPHGHAGPGPQRRGIDHALPRTEARNNRRRIRSLVSAPLVPVRRTGSGVPRAHGSSGGGPGERGCAAAGRVPRPFSSGGTAQRLRVRQNGHRQHPRSQKQAGAEVRPAGFRRGRFDRRTVGPLPLPRHVPERRRGQPRRHRVLRGRRGRDAPRSKPKSCFGATIPNWPSGCPTRESKRGPLRRAAAQSAREILLVGNRPAPGDAQAFRELAEHIARGSQAVFLSFDVFRKGDNPTGWLPLAAKGTRANLPNWLYHKDDWAKSHPVFRRPACRLHSRPHRLSRDHLKQRFHRTGRSVRSGCRHDRRLEQLRFRLDDGRVQTRLGPIHAQHVADPREPRCRSGCGAPAAQPAALRRRRRSPSLLPTCRPISTSSSRRWAIERAPRCDLNPSRLIILASLRPLLSLANMRDVVLSGCLPDAFADGSGNRPLP